MARPRGAGMCRGAPCERAGMGDLRQPGGNELARWQPPGRQLRGELANHGRVARSRSRTDRTLGADRQSIPADDACHHPRRSARRTAPCRDQRRVRQPHRHGAARRQRAVRLQRLLQMAHARARTAGRRVGAALRQPERLGGCRHQGCLAFPEPVRRQC